MEESTSNPIKKQLTAQEEAQIKSLKDQIKELSGTSSLARKIISGLTSAFKPDDGSADAFDQLIEFVTWLYVEDLKAEKLAAKFKCVTKTDKLNGHSMNEFITHCYPLIHARHRKEEVAMIMKTLSKDLAYFTADREATFKDPSKLSCMMTVLGEILAKHKSFKLAPKDSSNRAGFTCLIILHEKTACTLLTEYVIKNGLSESPNYKDLKTRKLEEVRIVLQDVSPLELASMADRL